ncbi:MAG TPA: hypothetical protein VGM50_23015 [Gemmatimonadaceae bacterium]|jgi:hypothetical protein
MKTEALCLAEIEAYDRALGTTRILRFANRPFTTKPSESPANTAYEVCLDTSDISRSLFASAATTGRSTMSLGDLKLNNPDGDLDYLSELAFDARTVTLRRTTTFNPSYPSDFESTVLSAEQLEWDTDLITLKLRDRFYEVASAKLQTNKYLGNNALPAGLEGTAELAGKPKPVCLGVVKNVPAVPVNTAKLIYQVNDGAVASIDAVRDRGVSLRTSETWVAGATTGSTVRFANGLFIAGDLGGGIGLLRTSPDGVTWTTRKTGLSSLSDVAYGAGVWLAVLDAEFLTSTDGVTWTTHTVPTLQSGNFYRGAIYHATAALFVVCGTGGEIYTSPDALTWTQRAAGTASPGPGPNQGGLWSACYGNGIGVFGGAGGLILSSADAITWTKRSENTSADGYVGDIFAIAFGLDRFVAVGSKILMTSLDGIVWTRTQTGFLFKGVMYANVFIAATFSNPGWIFSSVDGLQWIQTSAPWTGLGAKGPCAANGNVSVIPGSTLLKSVVQGYSSEADLLDDDLAPLAGSYSEYAAGGYFRLGGSPDGTITSDVTEGATSADHTAGAIANKALGRVPSAPSFDSGDLTALDAADDSACGYWTVDDSVTCDQVIDLAAGTPGGSWFPDKAGTFRIAQFAAPSGTPALVITKADVVEGTLKRITSNDQGNGIPFYQVVVQYARYYQTLTTDIAGIVSDADRADFAQEWRNAPSTDLPVLDVHPSAGVLTIQSLYAFAADAQAEANRRLALRKVKRDPYEVTIELNDDSDALELNDVVEVIYPRYSLSVVGSPSQAATGIGTEGGGLFIVLDARPNAAAKELTLTVWGGARYKNVIDKSGAYVVDHNGAFVIERIAA